MLTLNLASIVREPSPVIFGAIHLTMNKYFDVDELFENLVSDESTSVRERTKSKHNLLCPNHNSRPTTVVVLFRKITATNDLLYLISSITRLWAKNANLCHGSFPIEKAPRQRITFLFRDVVLSSPYRLLGILLKD
jgi:hypothetical protein